VEASARHGPRVGCERDEVLATNGARRAARDELLATNGARRTERDELSATN